MWTPYPEYGAETLRQGTFLLDLDSLYHLVHSGDRKKKFREMYVVGRNVATDASRPPPFDRPDR